MNIFIICTVRGASDEYKQELEKYVADKESEGHKVHLPHRDTDQNKSGYEICMTNYLAISSSDEVHVFYSSTSQGTHFDLGVSFALGKKIYVVKNEVFGEGKSFARMITEWSHLNGVGDEI